MKCYKEKVACCIECPYYGNLNGTLKTSRCDHIDGPTRLLSKDSVWDGIFPEECPLEDVEE